MQITIGLCQFEDQVSSSCIVLVQVVEPAPIPPPLKSPWAQIVKQQPKTKENAGKDATMRAAASVDNSKAPAQSREQSQPQRSREAPVGAKAAAMDVHAAQQRQGGASHRAPEKSGLSASAESTTNAAKVGRRNPANVKTGPSASSSVQSSTPINIPTVNEGSAAEKGGDTTPFAGADDKGTPKHQDGKAAVQVSRCCTYSISNSVNQCLSCSFYCWHCMHHFQALASNAHAVLLQEQKPMKPAWKRMVCASLDPQALLSQVGC